MIQGEKALFFLIYGPHIVEILISSFRNSKSPEKKTTLVEI